MSGTVYQELTFWDLYYLSAFVLILCGSSKLFEIIKLPSLLIEIIVGIVFGPYIINIVPHYTFLFLEACGKIGLLLLVAESGLKVDKSNLRIHGWRGFSIALLGSMTPFAIGTTLCLMMLNKSIETSIAIGACFAATSVGITLNIWESSNNYSSDTAQIIIVAAMLDDVIALILLAIIQSIKNGIGYQLVLSIIISPLLIIIIGKITISFGPRYLNIIPAKYRLSLLIVIAFILVPICNAYYSSSLLGAFLSGFIFCEDEKTIESWNSQMKMMSDFMVKFFFAATIAFQIPIQTLFKSEVVFQGLLFFLCIIGKLITGIFATPGNFLQAIKISFSMSAWGEFAFLVATTCQSNQILNNTEFSSIIFAILLSIILSPLALKFIFWREGDNNNQREHNNVDNNHAHVDEMIPINEVAMNIQVPP